MDEITLDWASAEVDDGTLEVPLNGEPPRGWKASFERTVALLPGGQWGRVKLKKGRVRVRDVGEGREEELRHFLEGVIQQGNADCGVDQADDAADGDGDADDSDAQMAARFRSFAAEPDE
jgi:hypothetical protein